jgi:hypothetical protein
MNFVLDARPGETVMLPITTHRSIHVPHTLAIAAALVAMIAAFGWNEREPATLAGRDAEQRVEAVADTAPDRDDRLDHAAAASAPHSCGRSSNCLREHGLLPLVLPALPSR